MVFCIICKYLLLLERQRGMAAQLLIRVGCKLQRNVKVRHSGDLLLILVVAGVMSPLIDADVGGLLFELVRGHAVGAKRSRLKSS